MKTATRRSRCDDSRTKRCKYMAPFGSGGRACNLRATGPLTIKMAAGCPMCGKDQHLLPNLFASVGANDTTMGQGQQGPEGFSTGATGGKGGSTSKGWEIDCSVSWRVSGRPPLLPPPLSFPLNSQLVGRSEGNQSGRGRPIISRPPLLIRQPRQAINHRAWLRQDVSGMRHSRTYYSQPPPSALYS